MLYLQELAAQKYNNDTLLLRTRPRYMTASRHMARAVSLDDTVLTQRLRPWLIELLVLVGSVYLPCLAAAPVVYRSCESAQCRMVPCTETCRYNCHEGSLQRWTLSLWLMLYFWCVGVAGIMIGVLLVLLHACLKLFRFSDWGYIVPQDQSHSQTQKHEGHSLDQHKGHLVCTDHACYRLLH